VDQVSSVPLHPVPLPPLPVMFTGDRGEFRRLVARGAGLELITVGFYRFWLATDIRRHLWSNTAIDGDAAEYTGRGRELLIGFLFALAILVPIYLDTFWSASKSSASRPSRVCRCSCFSICSDNSQSTARGGID
jgi:Bacterial protein of unknown function (DUF898)